ncbi:hypothetical protein [Ferruginibacter sp.]
MGLESPVGVTVELQNTINKTSLKFNKDIQYKSVQLLRDKLANED